MKQSTDSVYERIEVASFAPVNTVTSEHFFASPVIFGKVTVRFNAAASSCAVGTRCSGKDVDQPRRTGRRNFHYYGRCTNCPFADIRNRIQLQRFRA